MSNRLDFGVTIPGPPQWPWIEAILLIAVLATLYLIWEMPFGI